VGDGSSMTGGGKGWEEIRAEEVTEEVENEAEEAA
jgi:hypothetical protein